MSAATDLFAPEYLPQPAPSRRHLSAVPDRGEWSDPIEVSRSGSVAVLHAPEAESVPLRLTRRGVVVLSLLVAALGAALVWVAALSHPDVAPAPAAVPAAASTVTVQAGDTLWSIAGRVAPGADPRAEVEQLRRLNGLDDVAVQPGQQLRVR